MLRWSLSQYVALLLLGGLCAVLLLVDRSTPRAILAQPNADDQEYSKTIKPLLAKYCFACHGEKLAEADIDLSTFTTKRDLQKATRVWLKVADILESGQMPPKQAKQPTDAERTQLRTWLKTFLQAEVKAHTGDPGRVTVRRLSNAEYTYTLQDLTGVPTLSPAKEFPLDGAAGEGFTNTGDALVMSPALVTKYLDAAKDVANHAVLLPEGIRFSSSKSRRDWTNEALAAIRTLYAQYTVPGTTTKINLQGVVFDEREGGRLPLEKYLLATVKEREALQSGRKSFALVAQEHGLSAVYLEQLWKALQGTDHPLLMDGLRQRWKNATPNDTTAIANDYAALQASLWKTNTVGHIGRLNGPKSWMEPVDPTTTRLDIRIKLPPTADKEQTLYLAGHSLTERPQDVIWQQPKFVAPGQPEISLKDLRAVSASVQSLRQQFVQQIDKYLQAADVARTAKAFDHQAYAKEHGLHADLLRNWLEYLGVATLGPVQVQGHFTKKMNDGTYKFVAGWGSGETPLVIANSSDQHVRVPGNMKPHSVAVHPSPTLSAAIGWQAPVGGTFKIQAKVQHAHPECGNGVTWTLERRYGTSRQKWSSGIAQGAKEATIGPVENVTLKQGDLVTLVIGPRDGNHSCDLTEVDITLSTEGKTWQLSKDVANNLQDANPHADSQGNKAVWHFFTEAVAVANQPTSVLPKDSLLDRWQRVQGAEKATLAAQLGRLLLEESPAKKDDPNTILRQQMLRLNGPLFGSLRRVLDAGTKGQDGLDPALFGIRPTTKEALDATSLCTATGTVHEVRFPGDLLAGYEFMSAVVLHPSATGAAQVQAAPARPMPATGLRPGNAILVANQAKEQLAASFRFFRELFPPVVCYSKIVPVDEVVTLTLYYREDHLLAKLFLNEAQRQQLDRLWNELHFISQDALTQVDAFHQLLEYASQDSDPKLFEPLRKPIYEQAALFKKQLLDAEAKHLQGVLHFAGKAYRRPLRPNEADELKALYQRLRATDLAHEQAIRLTLARVLVSPHFLYKGEQPGPDVQAIPVQDHELASRLSFFLTSSGPDAELLTVAASGKLREPTVLREQTQRLMKDERTRRWAKEFAMQWLHIASFDTMNEKSEKHFPTFLSVRNDLAEESLRFFADLMQRNGSILEIIDADHTFLNETLAKHYGIPGVVGPQWRRVEGVKKFGRGGIFAQGTTLATQAGASRTSPILRGNWISEVILGEKLPKPPKGVPTLPEDEQTATLTQRQLVEKHSADPKCAVCHQRIDPYGFSLEAYDAIGRVRSKDLGDRPIDTKVVAMDGTKFEGIDGLRSYLLNQRREAFVRQFCKKLLGYALGRSTQLSDEPLLDEMAHDLKNNQYRIGVAIDRIVQSRPFRDIRGAKHPNDQ